uniref:Uncharacterized protein n=1 Tax=Cacopsylla melanoneura TaxID=428564 RepID=A0A8D9BAW5_9HEMI
MLNGFLSNQNIESHEDPSQSLFWYMDQLFDGFLSGGKGLKGNNITFWSGLTIFYFSHSSVVSSAVLLFLVLVLLLPVLHSFSFPLSLQLVLYYIAYFYFFFSRISYEILAISLGVMVRFWCGVVFSGRFMTFRS